MTPPEQTKAAEDEEFSAAAPPDPFAPGTGETSFATPRRRPPERGARRSRRTRRPSTWSWPSARRPTLRTTASGWRARTRRLERGAAKLAKELLPALDHLELALKAAEGHEDVIKGFAIVRDELIAALGRAASSGSRPPARCSTRPSTRRWPSSLRGRRVGHRARGLPAGLPVDGAVLRPARVVVAQ